MLTYKARNRQSMVNFTEQNIPGDFSDYRRRGLHDFPIIKTKSKSINYHIG